jgi:CheY-like chemotaxis protein
LYPTPPIHRAEGAERRQEPHAPTCRILVVDDNRHHLDILTALLEAGDHQVVTCQSGAEALVVLGDRRFDVVVLDMVMPEINGLQILKAMRAGGPNAQTPVFACTANYLLARRELEGCFGVVEIIAKPIDAGLLLAAVGRIACMEGDRAA